MRSKILGILAGAIMGVAAFDPAQAVTILEATATGTDVDGNLYSFGFLVVGDGTSKLNVTLTNTTSTTPPDSLIDKFAFNMDATLGLAEEFSVENFGPATWTVADSTGGYSITLVQRAIPGGPVTKAGIG